MWRVAKICSHCFFATTTHTTKQHCCECEEISAIYRQCSEIYRWIRLYVQNSFLLLAEWSNHNLEVRSCYQYSQVYLAIASIVATSVSKVRLCFPLTAMASHRYPTHLRLTSMSFYFYFTPVSPGFFHRFLPNTNKWIWRIHEPHYGPELSRFLVSNGSTNGAGCLRGLLN